MHIVGVTCARRVGRRATTRGAPEGAPSMHISQRSATRRGITADGGGAMACGDGDVLVLALLISGKLISPENETRRVDLRNAVSMLSSIASISPCADTFCLPPRLASGLCCCRGVVWGLCMCFSRRGVICREAERSDAASETESMTPMALRALPCGGGPSVCRPCGSAIVVPTESWKV